MTKSILSVCIILAVVSLGGCCGFNSGCGGEVSTNTCCGSSGW